MLERVPSFIEEIEERGLAYSDSLQHIYSLLPNSICQAYTGTDLFHYFFPDFFFLFLFLFASSFLTFLLPGVAVNTSHCLLVMSSSSVFANLPRILGWLSASAFLQAYWNDTITLEIHQWNWLIGLNPTVKSEKWLRGWKDEQMGLKMKGGVTRKFGILW